MHVESQYNITAIVSVGENTACGTTIPAWDCSTPVGSTATIVSQDYSYNTLIISLQQGCVTGGTVTFQASIDGVNWFDITGWSPGNLAPIGPIYALQANTYVTVEFNLTSIPYFQIVLSSPITGTACGSPPVCGSVAIGYSADSFVNPPPCSTSITPASTANAPESICVNTASTLVLAANPLRKGLNLTNMSYVTISIAFGGNAAVLFAGITLAPGGSFWMDSSDFTTASVNAIADGGLTYTDSCCGSPPVFCALLSIQEFQ